MDFRLYLPEQRSPSGSCEHKASVWWREPSAAATSATSPLWELQRDHLHSEGLFPEVLQIRIPSEGHGDVQRCIPAGLLDRLPPFKNTLTARGDLESPINLMHVFRSCGELENMQLENYTYMIQYTNSQVESVCCLGVTNNNMCFITVGWFSLINGQEKIPFLLLFFFTGSIWERKVTVWHKRTTVLPMCTPIFCKWMCLHTSVWFFILPWRSLSSRLLLPIRRHSRLFWFSIHPGFFCHSQKYLWISQIYNTVYWMWIQANWVKYDTKLPYLWTRFSQNSM